MEDGKVMNKLNILYEDNHIIVVEKPFNILSQADNTGDKDMLTIIKDYIKEKYKKPGNVYLGLVHRLDRPVGGVMVFARTSKAAGRLSDEIRKNEFDKTYLAVVRGIMHEKEGTFKDYLKRDDGGNTIVTNSKEGKLSILHYKVIEENIKKNETLVEIRLETGRHHQIRVQFSSRGYPLCGDQRYGKQDNTQIALFAYKLEFTHPVKKEKMSFSLCKPNLQYFNDFNS